ncbi:MAG: hypothetical protein ACFFBI_10280, partial [Promethearchaeota archaeon]
MKYFKSRMLLTFFLISFIGVHIFNSGIISYDDSISQNADYNIFPQAVNRTGKYFENYTWTSSGCYINREQSALSIQPNIYSPNYNISHVNMTIENLRAINYTRNIEDGFSEFIIASTNGPTYIYQKFAIEVSQYVNNISILIQDINNPISFTDENSWEVAILNCSNDGNPNTLEALGTLKKAHPISYSAHWEVFNFKESKSGPIYLEISKTNVTIERGREKYWFAFRIKIPKDDSLTGGGPKFLYFNPDGEQAGNIGEGETFAISPDFH